MPELPEVETIRRDLEKSILNKKILEIKIWNEGSCKPNSAKLQNILKNLKITKIDRVGKLLICALSNKKYLLIHLRMTGQLILQEGKTVSGGGYSRENIGDNLPNKHTRVSVEFEDNKFLHFNDIRKFGYLQICNEQEKERIVARFGIEPLTIDFKKERFEQCFQGRKAPVKSILLNQNLIAGIGNIYADEICLESGIMPNRQSNKLNKKELEKLFKHSNGIIKKAIRERGTSFSNYVDGKGKEGNYVNFLKAYGRTGKECPNCKKAQIVKVRLGGRGTHFCPHCQK